eukprot:4509617-Pyramimonas_sp.AAC.1
MAPSPFNQSGHLHRRANSNNERRAEMYSKPIPAYINRLHGGNRGYAQTWKSLHKCYTQLSRRMDAIRVAPSDVTASDLPRWEGRRTGTETTHCYL